MVDYRCGNTINIFEWDKMLIRNRELANSSLSKELKNPSHEVDGIKIIDIDYLPVKLYAAYSYDQDTNMAVYLSSPYENTTAEMIELQMKLLEMIYMNKLIMENVKALILTFLVILITHTLFFMAYGYYVSGDPFIALLNFYENMYNIRW